jgi:hypothetical protein
MMDKQRRNSVLALASNITALAKERFQQLVQLKVFGFAITLQWACLGVTSILLSHVLFWILGAGSTHVDADGNLMPVPAPVVRMFCGTDIVIAVTALVGALGPFHAIGAVFYSLSS